MIRNACEWYYPLWELNCIDFHFQQGSEWEREIVKTQKWGFWASKSLFTH